MPRPEAIRNRLLAVIAVCLVTAGLRWSYPVSMPLAASIFVLAAIWPVKSWLDRSLPGTLSFVGAVVILLVVLAAFVVATWFSLSQVVESLASRGAQFQRLYDTTTGWMRARGISLPDGGLGVERIAGIAQVMLSETYTAILYVGVVVVLVVLGLPEVPTYRRKLREMLDARDRSEALEAAEAIAGRFRTYVGVTVLLSLITGVACSAWAFAIGLDLAVTWGVVNFLLNFIPVAGNVVGVVPPTLYALVQFGDWTMAVTVFAGFAIIQFVISNFINPWLQGRGLSLSPVAVIVALSFWSWVWGIAGALLAVPLTGALVIICGYFESSAWVARMLSRD